LPNAASTRTFLVMQEQTLAGRKIAVPETRELDVFAAMLERRGAKVLRCPLVAILDAPDPQAVLTWVRRFNAAECDYLVLLTGEGLRRIVSCIEQHAPLLKPVFLEQLARVRKVTRGPKPARALRELGLKPDIAAATPTTAGVIVSLANEALEGKTIGVQLYGTDPNLPLMEALRGAGAHVLTVAPYIYASKAEDAVVTDLLEQMAAGEVDIIAFTSTPQVERLFAVGPADLVKRALEEVEVAAIGPIVADALARHDVKVRLMPLDSYFMKPLTSAMADTLGPAASG
jgi:uroporphyrinogen-III synthase